MTIVVVCEVLQRDARHATGLNFRRKARRWGGDCHVNWREFGHDPVGSVGAGGGRSGMEKEEEGGERKRKAKGLLNLVDSPHPGAYMYGSLQAADPIGDIAAHVSLIFAQSSQSLTN